MQKIIDNSCNNKDIFNDTKYKEKIEVRKWDNL